MPERKSFADAVGVCAQMLRLSAAQEEQLLQLRKKHLRNLRLPVRGPPAPEPLGAPRLAARSVAIIKLKVLHAMRCWTAYLSFVRKGVSSQRGERPDARLTLAGHQC